MVNKKICQRCYNEKLMSDYFTICTIDVSDRWGCILVRNSILQENWEPPKECPYILEHII